MGTWDSDATLLTVLESSADLIMLIGADYKILYSNRTRPGLGLSKLIGTYPYDYVPHDKEVVIASLAQVMRTGTSVEYETRYFEGSNVEIWQTRVFPVMEDGVATSMTLFSRDVTVERRQEMERNRFFELSTDLLCTATAEGSLVFVTPSFTEALGYESSELLSGSFLDLVHPADREESVTILQSMAAGQRIANFANRCLTKSGDYRLLQWAGVYEPNSKLVYAVGRDITETRRLEEQFLQAQKLEVVGQLAGGVAHDFNNIILAVTLNAEMARVHTKSSETDRFLGEILSASERARALTEQLLAFSRNEVFNPEPLDVAMIIDAVYSMVRALIPESISIERSLGHAPFVVAVDRVQMEQVIMNLCLNSRDAIVSGTGSIRLSLEPHDEQGQSGVLLRVCDDGCGMSEEVQSRVLEPFFTTKTRGFGTGLGLVSVHTVVTRHGGTLDFNSEVSKGTDMRVWLPLSALPAASDEAALERCRPTFSGASTILLAEDDPQVRRIVVFALESVGLRVRVAADGYEAMRLADETDFDLAVLDLVMPKASGHEVFLHMRARLPSLPVIFSTGYSDGQLSSDVLALENVMLLRKPYSPDDLMQAICRFITPSEVVTV